MLIMLFRTAIFFLLIFSNCQLHGLGSPIPDGFIKNCGQWDKDVLFYAKAGNANYWIRKDRIVIDNYKLIKKENGKIEAVGEVSTVIFNGLSTVALEAAGKKPVRINYFKGNKEDWGVNIPVYEEIRFKDIYENIDLRLIDSENVINYEFIARGAADLSIMNKEYNGKRYINDIASSDNNLLSGLSGVLLSDSLIYSTFLGGEDYDIATSIVVDTSDNIYVAGYTSSFDFPTTDGAYQQELNDGDIIDQDIFVSKFSAGGRQLEFSTFIGSAEADYCESIAIDDNGYIHLTGYTDYSDNFPVTDGAFQRVHSGGFDAFIIKLQPDGSGLYYSTLLGGDGDEYATSIDIAPGGNAAIAGYTTYMKDSLPYPAANNAFQKITNGKNEIFIAKVDGSGSNLLVSTLFGGSGDDFAADMKIDSEGNYLITGETNSADLPAGLKVLYDTLNDTLGAGGDGFVAKFNSSGTELLFSTYLGGMGSDYGYGIAIDKSDNFYIAGVTQSSDFPVTPDAYDDSYNDTDPETGRGDVFVCKFSNRRKDLEYSTFIGGEGTDRGLAIFTDDFLNAYVTGSTDYEDFPTTPDAAGRTYNDSTQRSDAFLARLNPDGQILRYASYIGGKRRDVGRGVTVDAGRNAIITGFTSSVDFPTASAFDSVYNGEGKTDAFISILPPPYIDVFAGEDVDICLGDSVRLSAKSFGGVGKLSYRWSPPDYLSSTIIKSPTAYPADNITYTVTISDSTGVAISDKIIVRVHNKSAPEISGPITVFRNSKSKYYSQRDYYGEYYWNVAGGKIIEGGGTNEITVAWTDSSLGVVGLVLTNIGGCSDSAQTLVVNIIEFKRPLLFASDSSDICEGDTIFIDAGPSYYEYFWSDGHVSRIDTVTAAGDYWVEVEAPDGSVARSDTITVTIKPAPPKPRIRFSGGKIRCLTAGESYRWYLNDAVIAGETGRILIPSRSGWYRVEISGINGCRARSDSLYVLFSGVEYSYEDEIRIYPNPASDLLYLLIRTGGLIESGMARITVSDLLGNLVISQSVDNTYNDNINVYENVIDVSGLPAGAYIIHISAGNLNKSNLIILYR